MPLIDAILPEYDREIGTTRKMLERLPDTALEWRPHPKSMTLGELGTHLAGIPEWVGGILHLDAYDVATATRRDALSSRSAILEAFDRATAQAREAIAAQSDARLTSPWTLKKHGRELFTMPRMALLRSMLLNHLIHHRGQLSVYLRLRDVPLPPVYGPSADEGL